YFSSRRRHTRWPRDWSSDVCSSDLTWTDANRDYIPQCDLQNVKANGECGDLSNANFGTVVTNLTYDAKTLTGFGKRNFNWEFGRSEERRVGKEGRCRWWWV